MADAPCSVRIGSSVYLHLVKHMVRCVVQVQAETRTECLDAIRFLDGMNLQGQMMQVFHLAFRIIKKAPKV